MMYNPNCPYCDVELDFEEHYDLDDQGSEVIAKATGHCPHCGRPFTWYDVYELKEFIDLQEP